MTIKEAIQRIEDHIRVHRIGEYPHIKLFEALKMAIAALRDQEERDNPKPLTLDELRQMYGEPVWCQYIAYPELSCWGIVYGNSSDDFVDGFHANFYFEDLNILWLAYRHKPKEGTE